MSINPETRMIEVDIESSPGKLGIVNKERENISDI